MLACNRIIPVIDFSLFICKDFELYLISAFEVAWKNFFVVDPTISLNYFMLGVYINQELFVTNLFIDVKNETYL